MGTNFSAAPRYNGQVTEARLRERLIQVLALDADEPYSQAIAAERIKGEKLEGVVCSRVEVGGVSKCATFEKFYLALYRVDLDGKAPKERKKA